MGNSRTSLFLPKLYSDLNLCLQKVLVQREISDREGLRWPGLGFQKQGVSGLANIWLIPTKMTSQKVNKCESGVPELNILHRKTWSSAHSLLTEKILKACPTTCSRDGFTNITVVRNLTTELLYDIWLCVVPLMVWSLSQQTSLEGQRMTW